MTFFVQIWYKKVMMCWKRTSTSIAGKTWDMLEIIHVKILYRVLNLWPEFDRKFFEMVKFTFCILATANTSNSLNGNV